MQGDKMRAFCRRTAVLNCMMDCAAMHRFTHGLRIQRAARRRSLLPLLLDQLLSSDVGVRNVQSLRVTRDKSSTYLDMSASRSYALLGCSLCNVMRASSLEWWPKCSFCVKHARFCNKDSSCSAVTPAFDSFTKSRDGFGKRLAPRVSTLAAPNNDRPAVVDGLNLSTHQCT
eukprot:jgi/Ulvmu1/7716/UM039_0022.1